MTTMVKCPKCLKSYVPDLAQREDFNELVVKWQAGQLIQNVWPDATSIQREQLQTGLCSDECWDSYLGVAANPPDDRAGGWSK